MDSRFLTYPLCAAAESNHSARAVTALLFRLGVPAHFKGCVYLRECVSYILQSPQAQMTKELYPHVAKMFKTSAASVERAIRNAVDATWKHGNSDMRQRLSLPDVKKPNNSQFISAVAEYLRQSGE